MYLYYISLAVRHNGGRGAHHLSPAAAPCHSLQASAISARIARRSITIAAWPGSNASGSRNVWPRAWDLGENGLDKSHYQIFECLRLRLRETGVVAPVRARSVLHCTPSFIRNQRPNPAGKDAVHVVELGGQPRVLARPIRPVSGIDVPLADAIRLLRSAGRTPPTRGHTLNAACPHTGTSQPPGALLRHPSKSLMVRRPGAALP